MRQEVSDDEPIRRWLLGQLPEAEEDAIDDRLLIDDGFFERMEMIEDELIADYVSGSLSESDRAAFAGRFLVVPERRQQVKFALAMSKHIGDDSISGPVAGPVVDKAPVPGGGPVVENAPLPNAGPDFNSADTVANPVAGPRPSPSKAIDPGAGHPKQRSVKEPRPKPDKGGFSFASSPYFKMAASFLVIVGLGVIGYRLFFYKSDLDKDLAIVQELHRNERPFEARLSGLQYAPHIEARGSSGSTTSDDLRPKRDYLANDLAEMVRQHPDAKVNHAMGEFYLADGKVDEAVPYLEAATKELGSNAKFHNDLGVALLEEAKLEKQNEESNQRLPQSPSSAETISRSLAEFNRALELDPNFLAALFNRALCWREMGQREKAIEDWNRYLGKEPNSPWAADVKKYVEF